MRAQWLAALALAAAACASGAAERPPVAKAAQAPAAASAAPAAQGPIARALPADCGPPAAAAATAAPRQVLQQRHRASIWAMSFSPRGALVSTSRDGSVRLWDTNAGLLLRSIVRTDVGIQASRVGWDESGTHFVTSGRDGSFVFDGDGVEKKQAARGAYVWARRGGRWTASEGSESGGNVRLRDGAGREHAFDSTEGLAPTLRMTADGATAVAGVNAAVYVWRDGTPAAKRFTMPKRVLFAEPASAASGVIALDASAGVLDYKSDLALFDLQTGAVGKTLEAGLHYLNDVVVSPDGTTAVAATYDRVVAFDLGTGSRRWEMKAPRTTVSTSDNFERLAYAPDGRTLAASTVGGGIFVVDATTGRVRSELGAAPRVVRSLQLGPKGELIVGSGNRESTFSLSEARLVDRRDAPSVEVPPFAPPAGVRLVDWEKVRPTGAQLTRDGTRIVAVTNAGLGLFGSLMEWDARTGKMLRQRSLSQQTESGATMTGMTGFVLSPKQDRVAMFWGKNVSVRGMQKDDEVAAFRAGAGVTSVAWLDDTRLVIGQEDGTLALYTNGTLKASGTSGSAIRGMVFDAAGARAVTYADDGALWVWDVARAAPLAALVDFEDDEYLFYTPRGAYEGTAEVSERVGWVFDGPAEGFGFERFERTFRSRDTVLARLGGGEADARATPHRPPRVSVLAAPSSVAGDHAKLRVRVQSADRVDSVRVFADGRPVLQQSVCAADKELDLDVPLVPGKNRIVVTAFDAAQAASNPAAVDVASTRAGDAPAIWVVAAGVSRYPQMPEKYQLGLAAEDARGIAEAFTRSAGPGKTYSEAHVKLLTDTGVTKDAMLEAVGTLSAMKPEDIAIVFFAGHGVRPKPDGDMVLLTSEASASAAGALAGSVRWTQLAEKLAAARGRVLLLLDACHSGGVTQDLVVPNGELASALARDGRAGVIVFAAAKGRQLSYEPGGGSRGLTLASDVAPLVSSRGAHGFFTGAFLAALDDAATDRDSNGTIELSELTSTVSTRVARATKGKQTPWIARRETFGDFRILQLR